jgi:hypothetical protein
MLDNDKYMEFRSYDSTCATHLRQEKKVKILSLHYNTLDTSVEKS